MTSWATRLRATTAPSPSTARALTEVVPISTPIVMAPRELLTNLTKESYFRHYAGPHSGLHSDAGPRFVQRIERRRSAHVGDTTVDCKTGFWSPAELPQRQSRMTRS